MEIAKERGERGPRDDYRRNDRRDDYRRDDYRRDDRRGGIFGFMYSIFRIVCRWRTWCAWL